jgi:hypothetical protein
MLLAVVKVFGIKRFHDKDPLWRKGDGLLFSEAETGGFGAVQRMAGHGSKAACGVVGVSGAVP